MGRQGQCPRLPASYFQGSPKIFYIAVWWLIIQILGWLMLPLAFRLFTSLPDRGYTAAKAVGLLLVNYILWWGASVRLLRNDAGGILFAMVLAGGFAAWFYRAYKNGGRHPTGEPTDSLPGFIRSHKSLIFTTELLFILTFAAWATLRAYAVDKIMSSGGEKFMEIAWLKDNVKPGSVILEAPGQSYNYEGRISAFTGLPTVLGWSLHEGQWRGDHTEQSNREPDIAAIYTTPDGRQALALLRRWGVNYVIVGAPERRYIEQCCRDETAPCSVDAALRKFEQWLEPVFEQGAVKIYRVPGQGGRRHQPTNK